MEVVDKPLFCETESSSCYSPSYFRTRYGDDVITLTVFVCLDDDDLTCLKPVVPGHPPSEPGTQEPISNQRGQNNVLMGYKACFAVLWAVRARKRDPKNNTVSVTATGMLRYPLRVRRLYKYIYAFIVDEFLAFNWETAQFDDSHQRWKWVEIGEV
ncbi:hypothetical protein J6590_084096 [Homalodisca vitripennis]|nr:hypothetical protein J6590_084096 [Homalodisca vitripennis]